MVDDPTRKMSAPGSDEADELQRDERLAVILEVLLGQAARGEEPDIASHLAAHPDLADELKQLWGTARIATAIVDDEVKQMDDADSDLDQPFLYSNFELPCQFGDYELLEEIGRGGMGVVFKAKHVTLGRTVALKMLLRGQFASGEDKDRFVQEVKSVALLDHPNIVPVFEFGENDGRLFFSMPFVTGETLADRLKRGPLPIRSASRMMVKIAKAIQHAHREGVTHRDLKPGNILIDDERNPFVTDFGLAMPSRDSLRITRTGAVIGTPAFMSPEQAGGKTKQIGPASDVYSLGGILYNAVTGQPPFSAPTAMEMMLKVLEQEPEPPRSINDRVPRDLEYIILRCLQKPSELRYESAHSLADDLLAFLKNEPVSANVGRISSFFSRMFRETHHAPILENWGGLWMLNAPALFVPAAVSDYMRFLGEASRWKFFALWTIGLGTWATVFWTLRRKMGAVTFVERQIAHTWAAGLAPVFFLIPLEYVMGVPLFQLAPMLAIGAGMVFLVKAGSLSGTFYVQSAALFLAAFAMAALPRISLSIYGLVTGICFFVPGLKHYRLRKQRLADEAEYLIEQQLSDSTETFES
jgi:serine/threonine-protein kinase